MRFHNTVVFIFATLQGHSDVVHALPTQDWSQSGERVGGGQGSYALDQVPPPEVSKNATTPEVILPDDGECLSMEERGLEARAIPEWMNDFNGYVTFIAGITTCVGAAVWAGRRLTLRYTSPEQRQRAYACIASVWGGTAEDAQTAVHRAGEFGVELQETLP